MEDLKLINSGPSKIDFGNIYVNCEMRRTFSVMSNLRGAIKCRLLPDSKDLQNTFSEA